MHFNNFYFPLFLAILGVEIWIALCVHDDIIRPYVGDVLVIVLLYAFIRMLFPMKVTYAVTVVFMFACFIEILQAFHFVALLGLENNGIARTVLGTSFSWTDVSMYAVGALCIFVGERAIHFFSTA